MVEKRKKRNVLYMIYEFIVDHSYLVVPIFFIFLMVSYLCFYTYYKNSDTYHWEIETYPYIWESDLSFLDDLVELSCEEDGINLALLEQSSIPLLFEIQSDNNGTSLQVSLVDETLVYANPPKLTVYLDNDFNIIRKQSLTVEQMISYAKRMLYLWCMYYTTCLGIRVLCCMAIVLFLHDIFKHFKYIIHKR